MIAKSFILQCGKSHAIEPALGPNGSIEVLSFVPPQDGMDVTWLDIKGESGNILLHLSLRPSSNTIVLNAQTTGKDWDKEVYAPFGDSLPPSKIAKICVLDRGDNYLVSFSDGAGTKFPKLASQINQKASRIHYNAVNGRSIFSNPINVNIRCEEESSGPSASIRININPMSFVLGNVNLEINLG